MEYSVELVPSSAMDTAVVVERVAQSDIAAFFGAVLPEVIEVVGQTIVGPPFLRVLDMGPPFLMEVGFPVAGPIDAAGRVVASTLPEAQVARTTHTGSYDGLPAVYEVLSGWITEQGMEVSGPPWESYLDGPEVPEPRTVVSWPCR